MKLKLLLLLILLLACSAAASDPGDNDELIMVQVLMRHGDRSPQDDTPITPLAPLVFFRGAGHLTNEGLRHAQATGAAYQSRYQDFININFMPSEVQCQASDVPRVLMTASAMTSSMFNSFGVPVPAPIQTVPYSTDTTLAVQFGCSNGWEDQLEKYGLSPSTNMPNDILAAMRQSEWPCTDPAPEKSDTLLAENANPITRLLLSPAQKTCASDPARKFMFDYLEALGGNGKSYNPVRLQRTCGTLGNLIVDSFLKKFHCHNQSSNDGACALPNMHLNFAHDINELCILNLFSNQKGAAAILSNFTPNFASSVSIELRLRSGQPIVKIFLKDGVDADFVEFRWCEYMPAEWPRIDGDCTLSSFERAKDKFAVREQATCLKKATCCNPLGIWGEWTSTGPCATSCGSYSTATRTRTCLSLADACPCVGDASDTGPCGTSPCPHPAAEECNPPFKKSVNGNTQFDFCGSGDTPADPTDCTPPNCYPTGGIWGEWSTSGNCATSCGSCSNATRTRTCLSQEKGCPCTGEASDTGPCNPALCPFPSAATCCSPYVKSHNGNTNGFFCGTGDTRPDHTDCPAVSCPPGGIWTEWADVGSCPTTCGSCSSLTRTRRCVSDSDGCPCTGASMATGPCGTALCPWPGTTCCGHYVKSSNLKTSTFYCGKNDDRAPPTFPCCPEKSGTYWSAWGEWTNTCLTTGGRSRRRVCNGMDKGCPCDGEATQQEKCCCPAGGVWSEWGPSSGTCATTCGSCTSAARTRTCNSEKYDCPCDGPTTDTGPCARAPCPRGDPCCAGFSVLFNRNNGESYCGTNDTAVPLSPCCNSENAGTWSEWSEWGGSDCNTAKCGLCDKLTRERSCLLQPSGCPCDGPGSEQKGCGNNSLCEFPTKTCCPPAEKTLFNNTLICA